MAFDLDMIKGEYTRMLGSDKVARKVIGRPVTAAEKVFNAHLREGVPSPLFNHVIPHVAIATTHVAHQDGRAHRTFM